jgi:hypothetical protein
MGLFRTSSGRSKTTMLAVESLHKEFCGFGDSQHASKHVDRGQTLPELFVVPLGYTILHGVTAHRTVSSCNFSVLPNKKVIMVEAVNEFTLQ